MYQACYETSSDIVETVAVFPDHHRNQLPMNHRICLSEENPIVLPYT